MYLGIVKIEGQWVTIEWGKETFTIPKYFLPGGVRVGDEVKFDIQLQKDSGRLRRDKTLSRIEDNQD